MGSIFLRVVSGVVLGLPVVLYSRADTFHTEPLAQTVGFLRGWIKVADAMAYQSKSVIKTLDFARNFMDEDGK